MSAQPITSTIEVEPSDLEALVRLAHRELALFSTRDVRNCGFRCDEGQHEHHVRLMVGEAMAGRVLP